MYKRNLNGNFTSTSSELGKILINSKDARNISIKIRELVKSHKHKPTCLTITNETKEQIILKNENINAIQNKIPFLQRIYSTIIITLNKLKTIY